MAIRFTTSLPSPAGGARVARFAAIAAVVGALLAGGPVTHAAADPSPPPSAQPADGYWFVAGDGGVFSFGRSAVFQGSAGDLPLNAPIVGMAPTPDGFGYWLVASDGGIFTYGNAEFFGSAGGSHLTSPIVGIAATPTGHGYWLLQASGAVLKYGDAIAGTNPPVPSPAVAISADPAGSGYRIVFRDGSVLSSGAPNLGSPPLLSRDPAVGIASLPGGYWITTASGKVYSFGAAVSYGQITFPLNAPIVGIAAMSPPRGYDLLGRDGGVFSFGNANFDGSTGNQKLNSPVLGIAIPAQSPTAPAVHFDSGNNDETVNVHIGTSVVVTLSGGGSWMPSTSSGIATDTSGPNSPSQDPAVFTFATVGLGAVELNFFNTDTRNDVVLFVNVMP